MTPTEKQGYASKTSRSGRSLFTSTNDRFFVLIDGKISYYTTPTKEVMKGSMLLQGASVSKKSSTEIYIKAKDASENGLQMSFKTEEDCLAWFYAINDHIVYLLDDKSREYHADDISDEMLERKFESFFGSFDERSIQRLATLIRRKDLKVDNFEKLALLLGYKLSDDHHTDASLPPELQEFQVLAESEQEIGRAHV